MAKNTKKSPTKKVATTENKTRKLAKPTYRTFRLQKHIKNSTGPIPNSFKLMQGNIRHLIKFKKLFLGISGVYFVLSLILVSGLVGGTDYSLLKSNLADVMAGKVHQWGMGITLFGVLISGGNSGSISEVGNVYQTILLILLSLVIIWALRQSYAKTKATTKDAFYRSMSPLIPFVLVLLVVGLQLIPLLIGSTLYAIVIGQGIAVTLVEKILWGLLVLGLFVLTIYMICSSVFALYIVTLPGLTPMKALRSARELVLYRRWSVMRKVIFLPVSLFVMAAIIMIPVLLYATFLAQWIFIFLTMIALVVVHGYMYRLYRELL